MLKKLKKLRLFLGPRVVKLIMFSSFIGIFSFAAETSFVFIVQLFLINLNLVSKEVTFLPDWLPSTPMFGFLMLILFGVGKGLSYGGKVYYGVKANQALVNRLRKHLLGLGLLMGGKVSSKELTTAFTELTTQAGLVAEFSSRVIVAGVSGVLFLAYGAMLAPKEMLIGCVLLGILGLPFRSLSKKINSSGKSLVSNFTSVNESLLVGLKNNFLIKLYNLGERELAKGETFIDQYEKSYLSYARATAIISSFPIIIGIFIISLLTLIGSEYFGTSGIILMTFFYVFIRFAQAMSDAARMFSFVRLNFEGFRKLYYWFIKEDENLPTNFSAQTLSTDSKIELEAKDLSFAYGNELVFRDINFKLDEGDIFLIKGSSGSGKSTLLNVALGLFKPTEGEMLCNGKTGIPRNLSDFIGYVGPDPYVISGTIRENLLYGINSEKTDAEILEAVDKALLGQVVTGLEKGLDTFLADSAELSTGQKQRLSIARALLRSPKVLVLDEATSNLDDRTENGIVDTVKKLSTNIITIVVSHRDAFDRVATKKLEL